MNLREFGQVVSMTDASRRGVSRLVADAESGAGIVIERRGHPAAIVMGATRLTRILAMEDDIRLRPWCSPVP